MHEFVDHHTEKETIAIISQQTLNSLQQTFLIINALQPSDTTSNVLQLSNFQYMPPIGNITSVNTVDRKSVEMPKKGRWHCVSLPDILRSPARTNSVVQRFSWPRIAFRCRRYLAKVRESVDEDFKHSQLSFISTRRANVSPTESSVPIA